MKKPSVVFVEAWINTIYIRFANEYAKTHPHHQVYYITDKDALKLPERKLLSAEITVIGLRNAAFVRKLVYLPLYIASTFTAKGKALYSDTSYLHTFTDFASTMDRIEPVLIQSNVLLMPYTLQAGRYAAKHNIPFILRTEEQQLTGIKRLIVRAVLATHARMLKHTQAIVPWTLQGKKTAEELLPHKHTLLLPASVDTTMFKAKQRYTTSGPIKFIAIQRFVPYKDYPVLLTGFRSALNKGMQATLTIVGSGPLEENIKGLVQSLELDAHVRFERTKQYSEIPALLQAHDVLVHTGRNEAIGMVVPEAMSCGLPTIVCDSAGAITYLTKDTGIQFRSGDAVDLAKKMQHLQHATIKRMGMLAAEHIRAHYTTEKTVALYNKTFDHLLKKGRDI